MPLFPELTLLLLLSASLVIYLVILFLNNRPKYKLRRNELLDKFQTLRLKSKNIQEVLSQYILSSDANKKAMSTDASVTYGEYFKYLQRNHIQNLSDKEYARLIKTHNRIQQKRISDMLEEQETRLEEAEKKLAALF
jgi:hypothetical protein